MDTTGSSASRDHFVNWLLGSLSLEASVLHAGRYCGTWQASTAGHLLSSFHVVLDGQCWLHQPGKNSQPLNPGDSVLFLKDVPHHLSPAADARLHFPSIAMSPMESGAGTGLACGFFRFRGGIAGLLLENLPEVIILRVDEPGSERVTAVFELIRAETGGDPEQPSPLLSRLVELLFFYAVRQLLTQSNTDKNLAGFCALTQVPEMTPLLGQLLAKPGAEWSVEHMAACVFMSRSNFYRRFVELCGQTPSAFLTSLRMRLAAQRLESGDSIECAADHVGYRSSAAFCRAFKKATGKQPGAWRRTGRQPGTYSLLQ